MEKNEKLVWSGLSTLIACILIGYFTYPFNPNFAILLTHVGMAAIGVSLGVIFAECDICTPTHRKQEGSLDEYHERNQIEMFELVSTDVETSKLYYVDKACDALEKIASASGDGTFDKADIMKAAVDFRERANTVRRRTATLVEARKNGHVDGVKELLERYTSDHLFSGFDDAVMNYLPESFHNANYLHVDEAIYGNYKVLKGLC